MKKRGKIDNQSLQKLGLDIEIKENVHEENQGGGVDLDSIKNKHQRELKDLQEREFASQREREKKIQSTDDEQEKDTLT